MDYYSVMAEMYNDRDSDDDEPLQTIIDRLLDTIDRLRETIESQALEILRLKKCIGELERENVTPLCVPGEEGHELFGGRARSW